MNYSPGATTRTVHPFAADFISSSVTVPAHSAHAAQKMTVQQLRNANRPPFDHANYTLPLKCAADNWHMTEFDAQIEFLRNPEMFGVEIEAASLIHEQHRQSLLVTREAVQDFMNNGDCPVESSEFKALALFLLTNKLFGALTWLVV